MNPFSDWGFKRVFGQEANKDLLINFLNSLFEGERRIMDVTYRDKEQLPFSKDTKGAIYDIFCVTDTGEHIIVEMQNRYHEHFVERTVYYGAYSILRQKMKGDDDYDFAPVYVICFMNFEMEGDEFEELRTEGWIMNPRNGRILMRKLRFIYLMLPRFEKSKEECVTNFEKWIYVLKNMETLDTMPFTEKQALFRKLAEVMDTQALTRDEFDKYFYSMKKLRDSIAIDKASINKGHRQGLAEGLEKGIKQGLEQGEKQGLAKGEAKERIKNARAMKAEGLSPELIAKITSLTIEEIEQL